jgi:hypothetical protein
MAPLRENPELQEYVAIAPKVVDGAETEPLLGGRGPPQSTAMHDGALALQVPDDWQVRVPEPLRT